MQVWGRFCSFLNILKMIIVFCRESLVWSSLNRNINVRSFFTRGLINLHSLLCSCCCCESSQLQHREALTRALLGEDELFVFVAISGGRVGCCCGLGNQSIAVQPELLDCWSDFSIPQTEERTIVKSLSWGAVSCHSPKSVWSAQQQFVTAEGSLRAFPCWSIMSSYP